MLFRSVVFTLIALGAIDRYWRRFLLLGGVSGLVFIYTVLGTFYHLHLQGKPMLVLVLAAIACYSMSLAPVTWVPIAEIFPNRVRSSAMSTAVTALWRACFVLTYTFPALNAALGAAGVLLPLRPVVVDQRGLAPLAEFHPSSTQILPRKRRLPESRQRQ